MKRSDFIKTIGLSSQALMAFYCLGVSSCITSPLEAQPNDFPPEIEGLTGNAELGNGRVNFSLDLTLSLYNALRVPGGFIRVGSVLLGRQQLCPFGFITLNSPRIKHDCWYQNKIH